jgi:hypothetical protein
MQRSTAFYVPRSRPRFLFSCAAADSLPKLPRQSFMRPIRQETASMTNDHAGHAPAFDDEHEKTYRLFIRLLTLGAVGVVGILVLLAVIAG